MDRTDVKVVKVVNLKRFKPETHHQSKKQSKFQANVRENSNKNSEIANLTSNVFLNNNLSQIRNNYEKNSLVVQENERRQTETNEKNDLDDQTHSNVIESQKDGFTRKVKFRKCTHTEGELNRLTEHCDETLVKVGDTFDSRNAFREYVYDKAKIWLYYYVCRNSKKNNMEYSCLCTAYNVKPREIIIRQKKQRRTACPCKIRLTTDESTKKVIVYYVCNHHDHDLSEEAFNEYPHAKHLPHKVKEEFLDLAYLGVDVHLIQKYIQSVVGVKIKNKTINSYIYKFKRKMIQRGLTAERKSFIYHLILSIRSAYDMTLDEKVAELRKVQLEKYINRRPPKRDKKSRPNLKTPCEEIVSKNEELILPDIESNYSIIDQTLGTDLDMDNAEVIIRYVNENGILCDENGIPIRNSTAIMHFINNYEPITSGSNFKEECLQGEDSTVFGELGETIGEEIYPTDFGSMNEINPRLERPNMTYNTEPNDTCAEESVSINDDIAHELFVQTTEEENSSDLDNADDDLNIALSNPQERLSSTIQNLGLYAEMENFHKYYFVDHRYIKHEDEHEQRQEIKPEDGGLITSDGSKIDNKDFPANLVLNVVLGSVLRHCSGHDDLTLLNDPSAIIAGATFKAHSHFLSYINDHASSWYFYYSLLESGKSPEYYVYKCVYGKQRVAKNAYRSKGLRKRSTLMKTQCPCQIRLRRLDAAPTLLTVVYSCNHHNHALDREHFEALPHSRRLPPHMKEEIKDLICLGVSYDVLRKYIFAETGHKIYEKYFHNVKAKMRRNKDYPNFTDEALEVLSKKIDELYALYAVKSKPNIKTARCKTRTRKNESPISDFPILTDLNESPPPCIQRKLKDLKSNRATQVRLDPPLGHTTLSIECLDDDYAEEVCVGQEDSCSLSIGVPVKRSRLEECLQSLSSHEETLLDVKKLQESARSETT